MQGDWSQMALYAGESAQLVDSIAPVATLFQAMTRDAARALAGAAPRIPFQKQPEPRKESSCTP